MEENNVVEIKKESKGKKILNHIKENWWKYLGGALGGAAAIVGGLMVLGASNLDGDEKSSDEDSSDDTEECSADVAVGEE